MRRVTVLLIAVAMVAASCSSGATGTTTTADEAVTTTTTSTVTTTVPVTTATVDQTTTTASVSDDEVTITKDIVYLEMGGNEYLVDVYVPNGEGPWAVVVALHGGGVYKDDSFTTGVAEAAAEAGMLVFAPNWVVNWPPFSDLDAEFIKSAMRPAVLCALAFAQQEAAGYGGDPDRTVVYGYSGGGTSGSDLVLDSSADLAEGCLTQTPPVAPVGGVFGDAEHFYHPAWWDGAFDEDAEAMQAITADSIDPASWTADLSTRFRIWAASAGSFPRTFDDPWDEDGWFALRDPDGTIRADLDELGELDDGIISYIDAGLLLATRLQQAGYDATFEIVPGDHMTALRVPEVVAYLLDAAGTE